MTLASSRQAPVQLGRISLRRAENALLTGGVQVGKSTLADMLRADYLYRYGRVREKKKQARVHISDTKPRYRAEWLPSGRPARRLYKDWDHGRAVPGSVLVESPEDMDLAWKLGYQVTIASSEFWTPEQDLCIAHFHSKSRTSRPQLLDVDETCDHFHSNGAPRGSGKIVAVARAGNERGEGGLFCSQRTAGISGHLLEYMKRLYAFRLDNVEDAKRFQTFGAPPFPLPTEPYEFMYWAKLDYHRVWGPYRLEL